MSTDYHQLAYAVAVANEIGIRLNQDPEAWEALQNVVDMIVGGFNLSPVVVENLNEFLRNEFAAMDTSLRYEQFNTRVMEILIEVLDEAKFASQQLPPGMFSLNSAFTRVVPGQ